MRLYYEAKILLHKMKWYWIRYQSGIIYLSIVATVVAVIIAVN